MLGHCWPVRLFVGTTLCGTTCFIQGALLWVSPALDHKSASGLEWLSSNARALLAGMRDHILPTLKRYLCNVPPTDVSWHLGTSCHFTGEGWIHWMASTQRTSKAWSGTNRPVKFASRSTVALRLMLKAMFY